MIAQIAYPTPDDWEQVPCRQGNPDRFFPGDKEHRKIARAKTECNHHCAARDACLRAAINLPQMDDHHGVFGGLTAEERRKLRKGRKAA